MLWIVAVAGLIETVILEARLRDSGRQGLATDPSEVFVYGAALVSASTVGLVVALRRRRHPVGWLFLGLALALSVGAAGDAFALDRAVIHGDETAGPALALVVGQASFIAWFGLLAAILHTTPTGQPVGPRWRQAMVVTSVAAGCGLVAKAVQDTAFDPPYSDIANPWALTSLGAAVDAIAGIAITLTLIGLVLAGLSVVVRFRRASGDERLQLRWMTFVVIPLPLLVVASAGASIADLAVVRTAATGGFVTLIPIVAGLSVQRYRLYDIDRILSRATTYVLSTLALVAVFVAVTAGLGRLLGGVVDDSTVPAVVATAFTVILALPVLRALQDSVDRRFDRRRYEAQRLVREHLSEAHPSRTLEATLAMALHDSSLDVAYWLPEQGHWSTADGVAATLEPGDIEVSRDGTPVARLRLGDVNVDTRLASELAQDASAELDNIRLRAELAAQLTEVRDSRARIVAAQATERRRIERNLHDGAQQRLLALAMHLRASQLRANESSPGELLDHAVEQLGAAVQDLRELANGLHPAVLVDAGLAGALDELAGRMPLPIHITAPPTRLAPAAEESLWFVACEAVANAVKHSHAGTMTIELRLADGIATLVCADDGVGSADPNGNGLRGIADRIEAAGGHLHVTSPAGAGTTVEAAVPCGS
jgi:signal transduction histidine kinase